MTLHKGTDTVTRFLLDKYPEILGALAMFAVAFGLIGAVIFNNPLYMIKGLALMLAAGAFGIGVMLTLELFGYD